MAERSLSHELQHDPSLMGVRPVLKNVQPLPHPQRQPARNHRNREARMGQRGAYMRSHVIGTLHGMPECFALFRDQPLEEVPKVKRDVRIGVFLNHQRAGGVLNENRQHAIRQILFGQPVCRLPRKRIEALAAGRNGESRIPDHDPV